MQTTTYLIQFGIFPTESAHRLSLDKRFHVRLAEASELLSFRVQVRGARVTARVDADADLPIPALVNVARSEVSALVDMMAYREGCGWQLEVLSVKVVEPPQDVVWTGYIPELRDAARPSIATEAQLYEASEKSKRVTDALADLRRAMREPWDSAFYCQRAIEMVRRHWQVDEGLNEKAAWEAMRTDLRLSEASIRAVGADGSLQRHGERMSVTDEAQGAMIALASEVITRFIYFLVEPSRLDGLTINWAPKVFGSAD